jgi:hypothetical protein
MNRTLESVLCFVGDNCSTNKRLAAICSIPLIGCASHRFNLAVKEILKQHKHLVDKVEKLMIKCRTLKIAGEIRQKTKLRALEKNVTRWGSEYNMLQRYLQLDEFIPKRNLEIVPLLLSQEEYQQVQALVTNVLAKMEQVNKLLQQDSMTMATVRALFNKTIQTFPQYNNFEIFKKYIQQMPLIAQSPRFEMAIEQLQLNEKSVAVHATLLTNFLVSSNAPAEEENNETSNGEDDWLKDVLKPSAVKESINSAYIDTSFIPPTSNVVERLFSKIKLTIGYLRHNLTNEHLEKLMVLHMERDLWKYFAFQRKYLSVNRQSSARSDPIVIDDAEDDIDDVEDEDIDPFAVLEEVTRSRDNDALLKEVETVGNEM